MNGFTGPITLQNFATAPVGIAIVWAVMFALANSFQMTTRAKVLVQLGVAVLYTIVATLVFLTGDARTLVQQGIILFCAVAFGQIAGYETVTKISGYKGDGLPFTFFKKNVLPGGVTPAPVVVVPAPAPVEPVKPAPAPAPPPTPGPEPAKPTDQGTPVGRI